MVQLGGFLGKLLGTLIKNYSPLTGNVLEPLPKSVLVPFGLTVVVSETDAAIKKKIFGSGTIALIFSNEELTQIMKIIKTLEHSGLLIKGVTETVENVVQKNKKEDL